MKAIIIISLTLIVSSFSFGETIDLFVLAGQSNAQGIKSFATNYPLPPSGYPTIDTEIRLYWTNYKNQTTPTNTKSSFAWVTMQPQIEHSDPTNQYSIFGPEVSFSRSMKQKGYNPAIYKNVAPATDIGDDWMLPGDSGYYDDMKSELIGLIADFQNQGHTVNLRGFIWIQGENDALNSTYAGNYESALTTIITDFRATFGNNIPVIIGVDEQFPGNYIEQIVRAQLSIAQNLSNTMFTSMCGFEKAPNDATHLSSNGVIDQGNRLSECYDALTSDHLETIWSNDVIGGPYDLVHNPNHIYLAGQFDTDASDEFLAINTGGWSQLRKFNGSGFQTQWSNSGNAQIGTWNLGVDDRFIIGDFENGGSEELLCLNSTTNLAELEKFNGSGWSPDWNTVNGQIVNWIFNPTDHYLSGNFDVSHFGDELLCINPVPQLAWSQMEKYDGTNWTQEWSNSGSDAIGSWIINPQDKYVSGNFYKNTPEDEIFCINYATQWAKIMKYDGTNWNQEWSNSGNDKIGSSWYIGTNDQYVVGDFDKDGADEVLCINRDNSWVKILGYNGTTWVAEWSNSGKWRLNVWDLSSDTHVLTGDFNGDTKDWIYTEGPSLEYCTFDVYRHLLEFPSPPPGIFNPGKRNQKRSKPIRNELSIYPNPANDIVTIKTSLDLENVKRIQFYSVTGALVYEQNINTEVDGTDEFSINTTFLKNGLYLVFIQNTEGLQMIPLGNIMIQH